MGWVGRKLWEENSTTIGPECGGGSKLATVKSLTRLLCNTRCTRPDIDPTQYCYLSLNSAKRVHAQDRLSTAHQASENSYIELNIIWGSVYHPIEQVQGWHIAGLGQVCPPSSSIQRKQYDEAYNLWKQYTDAPCEIRDRSSESHYRTMSKQ